MSARTSPSAQHRHGGNDQDAAASQGVATAPGGTEPCRHGVGWLGGARPIDAAISAGGSTEPTPALAAGVLERGLRVTDATGPRLTGTHRAPIPRDKARANERGHASGPSSRKSWID
jgi:hypothetical protein